MAPVSTPARSRARASRGPAALAALISGARLDDIAQSEGITPRTLEKLIRKELRKLWMAPAQDYARLQILRLETIASHLKEKCANGDLAAIDRLLKVLDRLDRYHGFTKFAALAALASEDVRQQLARKLAPLSLPGPGA